MIHFEHNAWGKSGQLYDKITKVVAESQGGLLPWSEKLEGPEIDDDLVAEKVGAKVNLRGSAEKNLHQSAEYGIQRMRK